MARRIDVHRHLLTPGLREALAARDAPPRLRRRDGKWWLEVAGEAAAEVDVAADAVAELRRDGLDHGHVALSAALGVESLPPDEARPVLDAWHADAAALPPELGAWGALALADPDVGAALAGGRTGLCLPTDALATPADLDRIGSVLEALERAGGALFVHPGPAPAGAWQPALTSYPAGLVGAWIAWAGHGRPCHPRLRVLFAALAGLAPLHAERVASRIDPSLARAGLADDRIFYDTSSYGPDAVAAVATVLDGTRLVYGSDSPWAGGPGAVGRLPADISVRNCEAFLLS